MNYIINLLLTGRKLAFADEKSKGINVVSNNDCFYIGLKSEEGLPAAIFARFIKNGNLITDILLDNEGKCKIPQNMLGNGYFEVGFYADGFATASLKFAVLSSVVLTDGIEDTEVVPSQTEQLIELVNSAPILERVYINGRGELVISMKNGGAYVAGTVVGDKGDKGDKGDSYVLTNGDKTEIASMSASLIDTALLELLGTGVME